MSHSLWKNENKLKTFFSATKRRHTYSMCMRIVCLYSIRLEKIGFSESQTRTHTLVVNTFNAFSYNQPVARADPKHRTQKKTRERKRSKTTIPERIKVSLGFLLSVFMLANAYASRRNDCDCILHAPMVEIHIVPDEWSECVLLPLLLFIIFSPSLSRSRLRCSTYVHASDFYLLYFLFLEGCLFRLNLFSLHCTNTDIRDTERTSAHWKNWNLILGLDARKTFCTSM